jgi:hypothetical protein
MRMKKSTMQQMTVTAQELIDFGLPRAVVWNAAPTQEVDAKAFIVSTLRNAYNDFVIEKLIGYFGAELVCDALETYKKRISTKLYERVHDYIRSQTTI